MSRPSKTVIAQVIGIVGLAIFMAMSVYWFTRNRPPAVVPIPPPIDQSTESEPVPPTPAPDPDTPPEPASPTPIANPTPATAPVKRLPGPDLTGVWELREQTDDGTMSPAWLRITLAYADDAALRATSDSFLDEWAARQDGASLTLSARRRETLYTFAGTVDPARTLVVGTVSWEYGGGEIETRSAHLIRLSDEFLQDEARRENIQAKRMEDVAALFNALNRFAAQNGGRFPAALSQIPTDALPDPAMLASGPGRTVIYNGGEFAVNRERAAAIARDSDQSEMSTEQLLAREQNLLELWGAESLVRPVILEVRYDNPPLTIRYDASGMRSVDEGDDTELPEPPRDNEQLRQSEFNNLKQLGLVLKMFEAEHKGYLPGGWLTTYPEYLTDPDVLHSPWASRDEVSYELVFPGARTSDLHELTRRLIDSGGLRLDPHTAAVAGSAQFPYESIIPAVVSRNTLPAEPGEAAARAVLFLDGHVEAIRPERWESVVAPFLRP